MMLRILTQFSLWIIFWAAPATRLAAQANALELKAAYQLAEENYQKGELQTALQFIDEVVSKPENAGARILYLKIAILKKMSDKAPRDTSIGARLDAAILAFEKAPDHATFDEERSMDVIKLKLRRKQQASLTDRLAGYLEAYQQKIGWIVGMRADSLEMLRKDLFVSQPDKYYFKRLKIGENDFVYYYRDEKETDISDFILIKNGVVTSHSHYYYYNLTETTGFDKSKQAQAAVLQEVKNLFGYLPDPVVTTGNYDKSIGGTYTLSNYAWQSEGLHAGLVISHSSLNSGNNSVCMLTLSR